jgi:hypothetical protein
MSMCSAVQAIGFGPNERALEAVIAQRGPHLRLDEERTMLDQRIESLQADVDMLANSLNATSGELDAARDLRERLVR